MLGHFKDMATFWIFLSGSSGITFSKTWRQRKITPDVTPVTFEASEYAELTVWAGPTTGVRPVA